MHLNVFASQNCFVRCRGCYSFSREEKKGKYISTDKLIRFLKYAYDEGTKKVTLCGGDPLAREDIIDLIERIKEIGLSISLDTVGSSIIKDVKLGRKTTIKQIDANKIAENIDVVGIPIDGSNNKTFKLFRQTKADLLNEQLAICEKLHQAGANICINTVAHKGNLEDAEELAKLIKSLNYINKWQIFQYEPLGKYGVKNRDSFEITETQFLEFQSDVLKVFGNDSSKVQFKSFNDRKNAYVLIDNSGNAWIPSDKIMSDTEFSYDLGKDVIIGNICNPEDWDEICSYLDRDTESLDRKQSTINRNSSVNSARREFASRISNGGKYNELISLREQFEDNNTVVLEDNIETKNDGSR